MSKKKKNLSHSSKNLIWKEYSVFINIIKQIYQNISKAHFKK